MTAFADHFAPTYTARMQRGPTLRATRNDAVIAVTDLRRALKQGTGRAALLLRNHPGSDEYNAELLHACTKNLVFDPQCEEPRDAYLHKLISLTGRQDQYRIALEARLLAATPTDLAKDIEQACDILARLIADGHGTPAVLRDFVLTSDHRTLAEQGIAALIRLLGWDALLDCARHFAPEITARPWSLAGMVRVLENRDGTFAITAKVREVRQRDPALDDLFHLAEPDPVHGDNTAPIPDYPAFKRDIEAGVRTPLSWLKAASTADIESAAEDLLAATDPTTILAYLRVFRLRPFPADPARLFPLLNGSHERVTRSAAGVLGRLNNPAIRAEAHRLIEAGQPELGAELLRGSNGEGDVDLLKTLLEQLASDEFTYHQVGLSVLYVIERKREKPPNASAMLLHLYQYGPCSTCREWAVALLTSVNGIPGWLAAEGPYDAEPGIAERFRDGPRAASQDVIWDDFAGAPGAALGDRAQPRAQGREPL